MKIFIPIGSFYPNHKNGPSLSLYWLSKCLTEESFDVTIYTTNDSVGNVPLNKLINTDFGKVQYVKSKNFKFSINLIWRSLCDFHKFDIIIVTSIFYPLSAILLFYSFIFNKKIIISPRGELYDNALNSKSKVFKLLYIKILKVSLSAKSRNYTFHATAIEEEHTIPKYFSDKIKIVIIPNYIYLPQLVEKKYSREYILFLGRIHPDKALDKLIDAFLLLKSNATHSSIKLVLTGDLNSKYGNEILEYIKAKEIDDDIEFVGFVEGESKSKLIANAICTVLISDSENFGNSILESLVFATPVITSTGTPWSKVEERQCGYWIENQPFMIKQKILALIDMNNEDYKVMCQNARAYAEDSYSIQKNKMVWMNLFKSL